LNRYFFYFQLPFFEINSPTKICYALFFMYAPKNWLQAPLGSLQPIKIFVNARRFVF